MDIINDYPDEENVGYMLDPNRNNPNNYIINPKKSNLIEGSTLKAQIIEGLNDWYKQN